MCIESPCDNYTPAPKLSNNMCWGLGATPPCLYCGEDELAHRFKRDDAE